MSQDNTTTPARVWYDSAHASLCILGSYLRRTGFFQPLETRVQIQQKTLKYTPVQKLGMFLVALLAGAKAVSHTNTTVGVDPALCTAFGLPGCADQSVIAATLNAATPTAVTALQAALAETFCRFSRARRHDLTQDLLVFDVDLSPLPASRQAEGSERCSMGRCRDVSGRTLVRERAAQYQETVWETVVPGRTAESLPVLQEALTPAEQLLGVAGEDEAAQAKRGRVEIRLDSGWGSEAMITWLLERGYQVTGKFKSTSRVRTLVRGITTWQATSSPGREVAPVPTPVPFVRPLARVSGADALERKSQRVLSGGALHHTHGLGGGGSGGPL